MTLKDKKELVFLLTNHLKDDINKSLDRLYDKDDIFNFDENMNKIISLEKNVKTIKDLFELECLYEKCENWFEVLEKEYIAYKYIDKVTNIDFKDINISKDIEIKNIIAYFREVRKKYNDEVKNVSARHLFKNFHDYVDKVWEEL